jgi:hypothetical protein
MTSMSLAALLKQELSILRERYLFATDETLQDPVFDGMVRQFNAFHDCLASIESRVNVLTNSFESLGAALDGLSNRLVEEYKSVVPGDSQIISDCYKFRESSNQIGRPDAPHSTFSKFKRDLDYNVRGPLRSHSNNSLQVRHLIELRNRQMAEVAIAEREGRDDVEEVRKKFDATDQHLFEWFLILEEHKGDILDSLLQTLKYLEYEFFASSAHAIAAALPARIEFRPLVEMTPKQLESQLRIERSASDKRDNSVSVGPVSDYSRKLASISLENSGPESAPVVVDILSLSSLLAQGFEEGPARKALRKSNNDTQAALDFLLNAGKPSVSTDEVRLPTTLKRIQRIKELKKRMQEKNKAEVSVETPDLIAIESSPAPLLDLRDPSFEKPELPNLLDIF